MTAAFQFETEPTFARFRDSLFLSGEPFVLGLPAPEGPDAGLDCFDGNASAEVSVRESRLVTCADLSTLRPSIRAPRADRLISLDHLELTTSRVLSRQEHDPLIQGLKAAGDITRPHKGYMTEPEYAVHTIDHRFRAKAGQEKTSMSLV